ncbi:E3 ubiquitin-protein ligase RBBP6-like [Haliaeetus albicilla]|uniref:E3 ubiquitin-protein ligase RBBP6-like n=1 Tax=Haliaeetus albicilla TaxID=8969 RepID=UPI0037E9BA49
MQLLFPAVETVIVMNAVNNLRNGTGYTKRLRQQIRQQQQQQPLLPPPPPPLMSVTPPAALVTAAEPSTSSSLSTSRSLEEKGYQVPVRRQPVLASHLGPQGQSIPTMVVRLEKAVVIDFYPAGGKPTA